MKLYSFEILSGDQTTATVIRNYVPCRRRSDGEPGLYETVGGEFLPNQRGSGRFIGSDEIDLRYSYVQFTESQRADTGYIHTPDTTVELVFFAPKPGSFPSNQCRGLFGSSDNADDKNSMGFFPWHTYGGKAWDKVIYDRDSMTIGTGFIYDAWVKMVCNAQGASWANLDGSGTTQQVTSPEGTRTDGRWPLIINGFRTTDTYYAAGLNNIKFRSFTISEPNAGVVRNFVPMRRVDGSVGFYDTVNGGCIMPNGKYDGVYGGVLHTVSDDDATISVYEGTLVPDELFGRSAVEKKGWNSVNASTVTSYPSLALCEGTLSFQDGVATIREVTGTLKFVGGARWAVDWVGTSCDSFSAASVDLTEVSAENPVKVVVNVTDATLDSNYSVELLSSGVVAEDAKKFVSVGVSAQFEVQNGKLLMKFADATIPVRAEWTGEGQRGKLSDVDNWNCFNCFDEQLTGVLPTNVTVVTIPAEWAGSFEWPESETLVYKQFVLPTAVTLTQDCDWRGMTVPLNGTITLNGHKLYLKSLEGSGKFTDTVQPGGELVVDVPANQTLTYSGGMKLDGTLKLVKTGAGTLQGSSVNDAKFQTFTGGTEILGGTVLASGWGKDYRWGGSGATASTTITIGTNGVFELQGNPYFNVYTFVLNGGTLKNSTKYSYDKPWNVRGIKTIRLESDSFLDFKGYSIMDWDGKNRNLTSIDLQGHTLTINFTQPSNNEHCYFSNVTAESPGTLVFNGPLLLTGGEFNGPKTTLDLYGYMSIENDTHVGTYICRTTDSRSGIADRNVNLYVYERFKPITDKFWGCVLKNGATLDLSEWRANEEWEAWNVKGTFGHKLEDKKIVKFEDNATITVDLGTRKLKSGDKVIAWDDATRPADYGALRFKAAARANYAFARSKDGVYVLRGLVIVVR